MSFLAAVIAVLKIVMVVVTVWGVFRFLCWLVSDRHGGLGDFWEDMATPFHNWAEVGIFAVVLMIITLFIAGSEIKQIIGF